MNMLPFKNTHLHRRGRTSILIWVTSGLMAGCAASRDVADRQVSVPSGWVTPSFDPNAARTDSEWWRSFGSPELDALIDEAKLQNQDIAAAMARVQQADARVLVAGAALLPSLSGAMDASRQARLGGNAPVTGNVYTVGFATRYEIDLWGRNSTLQDAATQNAKASSLDHESIQLTVTASVASCWLQAIGTRDRVEIARRNLDNARRILQLVESRQGAGSASQLEVVQQRGLVAAQQRALAALEQLTVDLAATLAVLLGQSVIQPNVQRPSLEALHIVSIDAGLPSQLLTRRPDIARAESQLAAAEANVAAARLGMLPAINLSASLGVGSSRFGNLLANPFYDLAAGLVTPIFSGGRLAGEHDLARAGRDELLAAYRSAIIGAFADTEKALGAVVGFDAQAAAQAEELAQVRRAAQLSEVRYRSGAETLLTLLDAQRRLFEAQDLAVQLQQARLQARVDLYRALGGGWVNDSSVAGK